MSPEPLQVVQDFYAAMGRGDVAAVMGALDPNVEWNEAEHFVYADKNPYVGPDNLLNGLFMRLVTEWEGFKAVADKYVTQGETVAAFGRYGGTFRATGKSINAQMVHVFTVANGKITRFQQYTDTAQFADACR